MAKVKTSITTENRSGSAADAAAKEKPSVLEQLNKLKELVAAILPDKVRHKSQERDL